MHGKKGNSNCTRKLAYLHTTWLVSPLQNISLLCRKVNILLLMQPCLRHSYRLFLKLLDGGRVETECDGTRKRTGGEVKGKKANGGGSQQSCTVSDTVIQHYYR